MALFATALNMEMGYAGMMPLGQSMFLGSGRLFFRSYYFIKVGLPLAPAIILALDTLHHYQCDRRFLSVCRGKPLTFGLLHLSFNHLIHHLDRQMD